MTFERDEGFRAGACELVKRQLDPECGCTEEEWETPWGYLGLHLSAGKPSDACLDDGEGEREITLTVATVDEARSAIFGWASALLPASAGQLNGGVEADRLRDLLDQERYKIAIGIQGIRKAIDGRRWLSEPGRGSYTYDDERYQAEFGAALDEIAVALEPLRKIAGDWSDCPRDPLRVAANRSAALAASAPAAREGGN